MWFWFFMLIMNSLIPMIMIGFGRYFANKAPKKINMIFGYRTSRSMKNNDTWEFAHNYIGELWKTIGWILLVISVISMLFVWGKSEDIIGVLGFTVSMIQLVILIGSIIPTEQALKRTFDKEGNRKDI